VYWEQEIILIILWLWRISTGLEVVLGTRLATSGLWRSYPYFFAYIAALVTESTIMMLLDHSKVLYKVWVVTRTILLSVETAAVLEIFNRWSDSFQGIGKFGKQLLLVLLALATGLCLSTVPINWSTNGWVLAIYLMTVANRAVQTGLAAFLILMLSFYTKFGGPVASNLRRHTWAMTAFVVATAMGYFLVVSKNYGIGQILMQAISTGTLIYWIAALRSSGEVPPATPGNPDEWAEVEAFNRQLIDFAGSVTQSRRGVGKRN
jgi:hypothetical protein